VTRADTLLKTVKSVELRLHRALGAHSQRSRYGPRFTANFDDETFGYYITAAYGFFYWDHLRAIDFDFVFLDIGANQGLYTIGAARNPRMRAAHAFEPVPAIAALCERNLALNAVSDRCRVINRAITDSVGQSEIIFHETHSGGSALAGKNPGHEKGRTVTIETIDAAGLSRIVGEAGCPIIVKIDVEGHEEVVIEQLFNSDFAPAIAEIFYEVDEDWIDPAAIEDRLGAEGFRGRCRSPLRPETSRSAIDLSGAFAKHGATNDTLGTGRRDAWRDLPG